MAEYHPKGQKLFYYFQGTTTFALVLLLCSSLWHFMMKLHFQFSISHLADNLLTQNSFLQAENKRRRRNYCVAREAKRFFRGKA